ncbi:hypothetical protein AJ80_05904 [Polytolypa hystricis UAMH7299]|uniref:Uncharacterized protein n=1 Tax=Polytolypa hystricis (strain UAMH7299) TaxID=1447883 RepID=A0A2B7XZW3_POLH7|nr:hypothetical protein AJ80_05904 [Polytolypa hystricis UAMH7299]
MKASVLPTTTNSDSSSRSRRWLQGNGLLLRALVLFTVLGFGVWIGTLLRKEPSSSTASVGLDFFNICNDHEEIKTTPLCQRLLQVTGSHLGSERKNWNHASIVDFVKLGKTVPTRLAAEVIRNNLLMKSPKPPKYILNALLLKRQNQWLARPTAAKPQQQPVQQTVCFK